MIMKRFLSITAAVLVLSSCKKTDDTPVDPTPPTPPTPPVVAPIDPNTLTIPVTSAQINGAFNYTKKKDVHPRLFFSAAEAAQIVTSSASDPFAKPTYDDVIARADALIGTAVLNYGLDGANLRITNIHTVSNDHLPYLVLAYQFTKNAKYAQRAWDQLNAMCSWPDWGANRHFLDAGIASKAVGMAFDGLYDWLSSAQRIQLYNALRNFAIGPGKNQIDNGSGPFKWYETDDNWNGICHGGMIMAALATYEMDTTFNSALIASCANGMLKYLQSFDPDGASEEGLSYWSYGLSNTFLALESMKRVLGATLGLTNPAGFRKTGYFPYHVTGPAGTASFGDDYLYVGKDFRFLSNFWFSKFFNDANMAKTHYDMCQSINASRPRKMNGWTDLLFYDKQLVNAGSSFSLDNSGYVNGVDFAYLHDAPNDPNAVYVGMHAGANNASHGHLDAGSFFIHGQGEVWAQGNLGLESPYPSDYFTVTQPSYNAPANSTPNTRGRYYYYRVRTEGKNCLVFNPDARPEQDPAGAPVMERNGNDGTGGYYVANLTSAYNRDVSSYKRGIKLNRAGKVVTVQDEFKPSAASTVYWLMHSPATDGTTISADGKLATMVKNGRTFYARIVSPANATFEKVNRSTTMVNYLPETQMLFSSVMSGRNGVNQWYGKLQIKLTGLAAGAQTTIRVDFSPSSNATVAPLAGLDNWTTSN
jgi:hypothetical protein